MGLWTKKDASTWVPGTKIWVKKNPTEWVPVTKAWIKKSATEWTQFWPKAGPQIEFPLEITRSSASWPSTLTGKNYHWENASTLSYKFQESLTNTTDNAAWTDLISYTTIANPAEGSFNTKTFSITSANFSTTIRSKWFRFVVRATDSSSGITNIEYSNTVNISKSALVGTAGTAVIARQSATSYVYTVTDNGTWSSTPESYSYQWQQLLNGTWTNISGATSISNNMSSFTGKSVRCNVFAVDDLGATSELPITSNSLFVDFAPPSVTSFTATGGVSKITYSYVVTSDSQFPTITLKLERLQLGGSYLQTNFVNLTPKTGTNVIEPVSLSGTYRATLTTSDGINPDSSIVVDNLTVANLNRTNVAIAQTTTNLSGATNITFSKTGTGSSQTAVIGWTNGSGVQTSDIYWSGTYNGNDLNKVVSGATQSSSFLMSAATGSASITATVVQKAIPQATISWNQTNAQSYKVTYRSTLTIAPGGFVDTVVTGNSSASTVSLIVNQSYATVRVLEVIVYEYPNQNSGQPTGSISGNFTITPEVQVTLGATQDFTTAASGTITYIYPTISGISVSNTTLDPTTVTSISVSNTAPSNTGSVSWANGLNTSVAGLYSMAGSGSGGSSPTDPSSLLTSGTFTVISTGTAHATIRTINTSKTVHATWTQSGAQSYRVSYTVSGVPGIQTADGNSSDTNPQALIGTSANTFTVGSVTVYPEINQGGSGVTLASNVSATGANKVKDWTGSGSVTYTVPTTPPSGGTVSVDPTTGIAGSTTFTASTSGWSGTAPITFAYSWQYFNSSFQWIGVATGTTFAPTLAQNSIALAWRVVVTATNSVGSATASANFTVNNPPLPGTPTSLTATTNRNDGVELTFSGSTNATSYDIYWNVLSAVRPASTVTPDFPAVSSPYLDTGITVAASRQYWVRGKNAQGTSEWFPTGTGSSGVVGTRISAPPFFPFFPPFFPFFPPFFPFFPPFFPFFPTFGVVTPTISGLSVSGTTALTGRTVSWTSTNQSSYSIATSPSTALNGATGATATSRLFTGLTRPNTYSVTVTVYSGANQTGTSASASTSFSTS
jgi:hypothetical protein